MMNTERSYWRRCSTCKKQLEFGCAYWVCNVSTCNRKRTGLVFCSVSCWDAHVPMMNHRESWAEERVAPSQLEVEQESPENKSGAASAAIKSRPAAESSMTMGAPKLESEKRRILVSSDRRDEKEVLVVVSKVKDFIRKKAEMNSSQQVMDLLSDIVRAVCEDAIRRAQAEGRKTVLERDIKFP